MIQTPVAVAILDNHDVIVADDYHVQQFDQAGRPLAVVGGYNLKPAGVADTKLGFVAVADKELRTVRFFHDRGPEVLFASRWPERLFGMPSGLAVVKSTGNVVVVDAERRTVSVHALTTRPPSAAVPLYTIPSTHFANPTHIAVDDSGRIFVSDAQLMCIKVTNFFGFLKYLISARI